LPPAQIRALPDDAARAHLDPVLRIAFGVAASFLVCESLGWYPTFLAPVLAAMLLASLPGPLPVKAGIALIFVQFAGAFTAFGVSALLLDVPAVLFGTIGLVIFMSFATIAAGRAFFPLLLVLVSFSTIPVVTMVSPDQGALLPTAFGRGMIVAVVVTWLAHGLWPRLVEAAAGAGAATSSQPIRVAVAGTAIVLPMMLIFLLFGLTDALPVLIATVLLVVNFDPRRGAVQGLGMLIGNLVGGLIALLCYGVLEIAPSLVALTLISLLVGFVFAIPITNGGPRKAVALITLNQVVVMFSLAIAPGSSGSGIWLSRVIQFGTACAFAVGMMMLVLPGSGAGGSTKEE